MQSVNNTKSLVSALFIVALISSMMPTQALCMDQTQQIAISVQKQLEKTTPQFSLIKKIAVLASFTTVFLLCSERARTLTCKAYYKSLIAALKLLKQCPLPVSLQEKLTSKIEYLENLYATRSGNNFTSEDFKALLKEFKELVDVCKAGKDASEWLSPATPKPAK